MLAGHPFESTTLLVLHYLSKGYAKPSEFIHYISYLFLKFVGLIHCEMDSIAEIYRNKSLALTDLDYSGVLADLCMQPIKFVEIKCNSNKRP